MIWQGNSSQIVLDFSELDTIKIKILTVKINKKERGTRSLSL